MGMGNFNDSMEDFETVYGTFDYIKSSDKTKSKLLDGLLKDFSTTCINKKNYC